MDVGNAAEIEDPKGGDGKCRRGSRANSGFSCLWLHPYVADAYLFAVVPSHVICPVS